MADRGAVCWESRLSGSERGWGTTLAKDEILWHHRETRWQTEKTNLILRLGESPVYSKPHVLCHVILNVLLTPCASLLLIKPVKMCPEMLDGLVCKR